MVQSMKRVAIGRREQKMKIEALVIPTAWMASENCRPSPADSPNSRTSTGNPTVPPPIGVEPAT